MVDCAIILDFWGSFVLLVDSNGSSPSANVNKSLQVSNSTITGITDVAGITRFRIESTFFRKLTVVDIITAVNILVLLFFLRDIEIIKESFILQKSAFSTTFKAVLNMKVYLFLRK